jgi:DnaJ-like protein
MKDFQRDLDERIGAALRESLERGELQRAKSWGKPLDFGDGYEETPADLRMGYKILRDAGGAPLEVELMREIEALNVQLGRLEAGSADAAELRRKIMDLRLEIALRIEALARRPL